MDIDPLRVPHGTSAQQDGETTTTGIEIEFLPLTKWLCKRRGTGRADRSTGFELRHPKGSSASTTMAVAVNPASREDLTLLNDIRIQAEAHMFRLIAWICFYKMLGFAVKDVINQMVVVKNGDLLW